MLLYYVPGASEKITARELVEAGLAHAFEEKPVPRGVSDGPGGQAGAVVAQTADAGRVGYWPEKQTWRRIPQRAAWVGRYTSEVVRPADLERRQMLRGHPVRLADQQDWLAPVARALSEKDDDLTAYNALPAATDIDEDGNWVPGALLPRYEPLWEIAERTWDAFVAAARGVEPEGDTQRVMLDFPGMHDAALAALAANYRIAKGEAALLGLFDGSCVIEVLRALIDYPTFREFCEKKGAAGGWCIAGGPAAGTPDTDPA